MRFAEHIKDSLVKIVSDCCWKIWKTAGPGFDEQFYKNALEIELRDLDIPCSREFKVDLFYKDEAIGVKFLDLFVDNRLIIEAKAVSHLSKTHYAQLRTYLNATNLPLGILVNFGSVPLQFKIVIRDYDRTKVRKYNQG